MDKELLDRLQKAVENDPRVEEELRQLLDEPEGKIVGISNKIKYLTKSSGHKLKDLAEPMQVNSKYAVNNKFSQNRFPFQDIIRIVAFLGGKVVIKVGDEEMEFTEEDL